MIEIPAVWAFVAVILNVFVIVAYMLIFFFFVFTGVWIAVAFLRRVVDAIGKR